VSSIPHDCPAVAALPEELREQLIDASRRRPIVMDRGGRAWETGIDVWLPRTRPLMHKPWPRIGRGEEERIVVCVAMRQQGTLLPIYEWTFDPDRFRLHTGSGITERPPMRRDLLDRLELRWSGGGRHRLSREGKSGEFAAARYALQLRREHPDWPWTRIVGEDGLGIIDYEKYPGTMEGSRKAERAAISRARYWIKCLERGEQKR
jgi:hypothetical protein